LNRSNPAAALAAARPHERDEADNRPDDKSRKPYPWLLTRKELQKLVAEQLG
jgi:hypothetical protein